MRLIAVALIISVILAGPAGRSALADVKSSKADAYAVISPPDGVLSSKANAYTVISPPDGVLASKASAYAVISPPASVLASKANAYAVISPPDGVLASKTNAYAVISPPEGVLVSKANIYVVIAPAALQPNIFITTKNETNKLERAPLMCGGKDLFPSWYAPSRAASPP